MTKTTKTTPVSERGTAPEAQETSKKRVTVGGKSKAASDPTSKPPADELQQREHIAVGHLPLLAAIGTQIAATHAAVKGAFLDVLLAASKCGLLLLAAKAVIETGEFEAWFERSDFGFTKVTRCKYMRLATYLCEEAGSKPDLLLSIRTDAEGQPAAFSFDELRLRTMVDAVSAGRSLTELYVYWEITKKPQNKDDGLQTPSDSPSESKSHEKVLGRWNEAVGELPKVFAFLPSGKQAELLTKLEEVLNQLRIIQKGLRPENQLTENS